MGDIKKDNLNLKFEKLKNSQNVYRSHLDNEKNINEKLEILKMKNNKIKILNPIKNDYEELINKRNLNKNIKKFNEILKKIKNLILNFNSNDNLNLIEKNLNKLEDIDKKYYEISQKFSSLTLDLNELINELENKFNSEDYDEINFDEIDENIYQYQQLSKFFEVDPENLFSI